MSAPEKARVTFGILQGGEPYLLVQKTDETQEVVFGVKGEELLMLYQKLKELIEGKGVPSYVG